MTLVVGAVLLTAAVVFFVLQPILGGRSAPMEKGEEELSEAEARRRVTLLALRDVEYDRATGKLDEADYRSLRTELSQEALAALRAEETERGPGTGATVATPGLTDTLPEALESEIRRVRQGLRSGLTCLDCGHLNVTGSRFCASCGTPLSATPHRENGQAP
jgi:cytochrome c-type biogenesis protein CcmI